MQDTIPLSLEEVERMRILLNSVKNEGNTLSPSEERELREYISRDKPDEAANLDLNALIGLGIFLLGLYAIWLIVDAATNKN